MKRSYVNGTLQRVWYQISIAMIFVSSASALGANNLSPSVKIQKASAYLDSDRTKLVYREEHRIIYVGNILQKTETQYLTPNGKNFASLKSNYQENPKVPTYTFHDFRTGYKEGILRSQKKTYIFYQEKDQPPKKELLVATNKTFAGQGWHYYLLENLALFQKGVIRLDLVLPGRLAFYEFTLRKEKNESSNLFVKLEISNWLLSMFAPVIELTYDEPQKRLLTYRGPSNIKKDDGSDQKVFIVYHYESP